MKKFILTTFGLFFWLVSFALPNIFTGATDANWGTSTNWSLGTVPTASDGNVATFNVTSPNCTVNTSNRVCNAIDFTGYTNTITMTFQITVSGAITFQANQSSRVAGAATLIINETATITSNGGTWPNPFTFTGTSKTVTLVDAMTVSGLLTLNFGTAGTINGFSINVSTNILGSNVTTSGTVVINMTGTGTLTTTGTGSFGFAELRIKSTASVTLGTAVNIRGGLLFTVEAGATVVTTGNTLTIAASCTMNTSVMGTTTNAWKDILFSTSAAIITLTSDLYGTGTLSTGAATTSVFNGAFNINWSGTVTIGTNWSGTATFNITGTTSVNGATAASIIASPMTWASGTITTTTGFVYRTNIFTISSGVTVAFSGTLTLNTTGTLTNNATGITINTISCGGATTQTINGTTGITIGTLQYTGSTATAILNLKSGNTYTVTTAFMTTTATASVPWLIRSSTPGSQATLTLNQGATFDLGFVNATDINSAAGRTIFSYRATLSNATNWLTLPVSPVTITTSN